jgi:CMP-N,N'-diacetyllegionaminic acid synthase
MKMKALVAVRSGSLRVENKNVRPFAGSSLLELKLKQLLRIPQLDGIVVNSNDDEMLAVACRFGCETIKRDPVYASNEVNMSDVYVNMAQHCDTDVILYANVTNPLLADGSIIRAIEEYTRSRDRFDSLNSAHLVKEFLFLSGKPINYDLRRQPRSQDLPDIMALNFAVNIIPRDVMIACRNVVGLRPRLFLLDEIEATDIDTQVDFDFAEFAMMRNGNGR